MVAFPVELDVGEMVVGEGREDNGKFCYDLEAVLMHKGTSAYSGHFKVMVCESG